MTEEQKQTAEVDESHEVEETVSVEAVEDTAKPEESAESVEPAESMEPEESAESVEPAESTEPAETEALEEPKRVTPLRQSLVLRGGSCDMRVGQDVLELLGQAVKGASGRPRRALLVAQDGVSLELVEECRRLLVDTDYDVRLTSAPAGRAARNIEFTSALMDTMHKEGITSDDPVIVVGDGDLISGVLYVTSTWYGGCVLAAVPTTLDAIVETLPTPRAIDCAGARDVLKAKGNVRLALCDMDILPDDKDEPCEGTLMGRAVMVASALCSGQNTFSDLAVAADKIVEEDPETLTKSIMDISKSRTRVASSTALAMRQGVTYGEGIARALERCIESQEADETRYMVDKNPGSGRLLAEGLRIAARLSAANKPEDSSLIDLVFTQDALLEKFGLSEVACVVEPEALLEALRAVEFERQNRFMPALPQAYGRVRLTSLPDELLAEHVSAWCKSRRKLARRRAKEAAEQ